MRTLYIDCIPSWPIAGWASLSAQIQTEIVEDQKQSWDTIPYRGGPAALIAQLAKIDLPEELSVSSAGYTGAIVLEYLQSRYTRVVWGFR
jgi:hypothetical protein